MAKKKAQPKATKKSLASAEQEMALAEAEYATAMLRQLTLYEQTNPFVIRGEPDDPNWQTVTPGGTIGQNKFLGESRDAATVRNQSYRFWRYHPQGRGILRNFVRFIIGREFKIDFDDLQHGTWNDDHSKLIVTSTEPAQPKDIAPKATPVPPSKEKQALEDPLVVKEAWTEFEKRNQFTNRRKEIILRVFRDGEVFIRRFLVAGRVLIRFVEPERVASGPNKQTGTVSATDVDQDDPVMQFYVGKPTVIENGIEYIKGDRETVVAYHIQTGENEETERVPIAEMIHAKAFADSNDLRGIPLLEVVAKTLTNYEQWEHYRMVLNKVRTAVALVRKVEGTAQQARDIINARLPVRETPDRLVPQTASGMREAMLKAGTILTPGPGVSYDFMSPKLDAKDAGEDGRRLLLSVAAGVGLPEMLITGDWSNSNYGSSVEARTPAVREWEDWQDFFEPVFQRLVKWVIEEAINTLGLPETTLKTCTLNWPILIAKDAAKETARNMNLYNGGILSRTTWAAREELNYDDELQNLRAEAEDILMSPAFAAVPDQVRLNFTPVDLSKLTGITGTPGGPSKGLPPNPVQPNEVTGAAASHPGPKQEAKAVLLYNLTQLREQVDQVEDEDVQLALKQYIFGLAKILRNE